MGSTSRLVGTRQTGNNSGAAGILGNSATCRVVRTALALGDIPSRRKHRIPSVGERFGELTVSGYELASRGGLRALLTRCSCGAPEHRVDPYNLFAGRSTRCNSCAKKASGFWIKKYRRYAEVCPDDKHRRRLLGRISAIFTRCNPKAKYHASPDYAGRGIVVYRPWQKNKRAFLAYLVTLPGWDDPILSIDRIKNNKGYRPGNLRFTDSKTQTANRRRLRDLEKIIANLRSRLRRAEKQIYSCHRCRAAHSS